MRHVWTDHLRQKYKKHEQSLDAIENFESYVLEIVDDYEGSDIRQRADTYIALLPPKQRRIITMRLIEEMSIKDIAQRIGKDSNYVKTTYKRSLRNLKQLIEQGMLTAEKEAV